MKLSTLPALRAARTPIAGDAEWKEGDHPRADNRQFGTGGGKEDVGDPDKFIYHAGELEKVEEAPKDMGSGLKAHPPAKMRSYTSKELDWEYEVEYKKYSAPRFPGVFTSRKDFQKKFDAAPTRALTASELQHLGNSMASAGIGKNEDWVHKTFSHRRDSKRILSDLKEGKTAPPIILKQGDHLHLMAGQTRLAAGMAIGLSVPAKIIDITKKQAHDDWQESKHPRDADGKFAETAGSVAAGPSYTLKSDFVAMMKGFGFSKIKQKNAQIFVHPSGLKVVMHPPPDTLYSSSYTSFKQGSTPKSGSGMAQFKKLIGNALVKAEAAQASGEIPKAAASGSSPGSVTPAEPSPAPASPAPEPALVAKEHGFSTYGYNGPDVVLSNGDKKLLIKPDGTWVSSTPGFPTKQGEGAKTLKMLLTGMTTSSAQAQYGSAPWVNSTMKVQTAAEAQQEQATQSEAAKKQAEQQAAVKAKQKEFEEKQSYLKLQLPTPTSAEASSVGAYSDSSYQGINQKLRAGGKPEGHAKNIEAFLHRASISKEIMVYRGIVGSEGQTLLMSAVEGEAFVDRGFMSTSIRENGSFGGVKMHMTIPAGSKGAYIRSLSHHAGEDEFLVQRNSRFRITKVDLENKIMHVTIEQGHLPAVLE